MATFLAFLQRVRASRPGLDHLIRAYQRYTVDAGDRLAAAVTYFGFLSFFPLLALAASLLSYVLGDEAVSTVVNQVNGYAPGLATQLGLQDILTSNRKAGAAGLLGLIGLLYSGLGWVDALRQAIRAIWHQNVHEGNLVVKKVKDVVILLGLGATVVVSVGVSAVGGAFTGFALSLVDLEPGGLATGITKLVGVGLGLLSSTLLFLYLFWRLPRVATPLRRVLPGAVLAAVLFELLKQVGALYLQHTTTNPLYGAFAVVVGLLVWINIVSRVLLLCAAWTVTAPCGSDVAPSGTADRPSTSPASQPGAPTTPSTAGTPDRRAGLAVQAGQFTAGALGMIVAQMLLHLLRTVRGVVHR